MNIADNLVHSASEHGDRVAIRLGKVAAYKYPRTVRVVDALPKGPTGKILKREIKLEGVAR